MVTDDELRALAAELELDERDLDVDYSTDLLYQQLLHMKANVDRYREEGAGLFSELRAAGFDVSDLQKLRTANNPTVVPVLLKWLPRIDFQLLRFDVLSVLDEPWARKIARQPLIEEIRRIDPATDLGEDSRRYSIADNLRRSVDDDNVDDMIAIATDPAFGSARRPAAESLGRMGKSWDKVVPVLLLLLDDDRDAVWVSAGQALGKLKVQEARAGIERRLDDPDSWKRQQMRRALAKLD